MRFKIGATYRTPDGRKVTIVESKNGFIKGDDGIWRRDKDGLYPGYAGLREGGDDLTQFKKQTDYGKKKERYPDLPT